MFFIPSYGCNSADPSYTEEEFSENLSSPTYEVWINGVQDSVFIAKVQDPPFTKQETGLDFGGKYFFSSFDVDKPVEVKIKSRKI